MADTETIDAKVESKPSFWGHLWKKELKPFLVIGGISLGVTYAALGGYHLGKANTFLGEYEQLKIEQNADLNRILTAETEREKLGLGPDFSHQIFRIELDDAINGVRKGRMEVLAEQAITEYNLIFNPFYEMLSQQQLPSR